MPRGGAGEWLCRLGLLCCERDNHANDKVLQAVGRRFDRGKVAGETFAAANVIAAACATLAAVSSQVGNYSSGRIVCREQAAGPARQFAQVDVLNNSEQQRLLAGVAKKIIIV